MKNPEREQTVAQVTVTTVQLQLLNFCMALAHVLRKGDAQMARVVLHSVDGLIRDHFEECERLNQQVQVLIESMNPEFRVVEMDVTQGDDDLPFPFRRR